MKKFGCLAPMVLFIAGCASGLQESYVDAMETTYEAVQADVDAGLYKPDEHSKRTLEGWKKANESARKALEVAK